MRLVAFVIAAVASGGAVHADPVRFDWTGTVTDVDPSLSDSGIVVGDPAEGYYTFESATPDGDPDPQIGDYHAALLESRHAVGSVLDETITDFDPGAITLWVDLEGLGHTYQVEFAPGFLLRLHDDEGTALSSDSLPEVPPELAPFETRTIGQVDPSTFEPLLIIEIETLTLASPAIPMLPPWGTPLALVLILAARPRARGSPRGARRPATPGPASGPASRREEPYRPRGRNAMGTAA